MNKIKMSLYFKLPATDLIRSLSSNACIDSNCDGVGEYEAAELAINSYDANRDLITKQAEQIKIMRKELKLSTDRLDAVWSNLGSMGAKAQADNNREALEATKPVEE